MDTIIALATPPGRSAIAVIRLSGADALQLARRLLSDNQYHPQAAQLVLKEIRNPVTAELIDRALVSYFQTPHSFTGEDVVEISCHGSPVVVRQIIDSLLGLGARLAGPGEFTLRALSSGKMNLSQAEAIRDLINSQTEAAAQQALRQLNGELSARLKPLSEELLSIIVTLESAVEFVEDDLPEIETKRIRKEVKALIKEIAALASTFSSGHLLRDGLRVTFVGRPNTGKSSLFNRLVGHERAIVTEIPGTTRDTLSEYVNIKGLPVMLTDTAGVRDSVSRVERMGVERTLVAMADADLLLVVVDGSMSLTHEDLDFLRLTEAQKRIIALNKSDLPMFRSELRNELRGPSTVIDVSAKSNAGLEDLRDAILQPFGFFDIGAGALLITDARHYDLLCRAHGELQASWGAIESEASEEIVLVGLHNALRFLGDITGETTAEDVLSRIFSTFCIGK
jgi:tRNA modification GTPase